MSPTNPIPSPFRLTAAVLALGLLPGLASAGRPVLLMHPTIVVFDARTRTADVHLVNRGDAPGVFALEWVDYSMTPEGGLLAGPAGPWAVSPVVRFSPRRVTLAPGETQVVRMALRRPADAAEGEYRSHLKVLTLPDPSSQAGVPSGSGSSVQIVARPGMSIPVIWRNGSARPAARIDDVRLSAGGAGTDPELIVSVVRDGPMSVRGYVHVRADGVAIAVPAPLVIYGNLPGRTISIPLQARPDGAEISYTTSSDPLEAGDVLATFRLGS